MELEKILEKLEENIAEELEKLVKKPELNPADIKAATEVMCLLEKIQKVQNGMDFDDGEFSESRGSYSRSRSARTGRYMSSYRGYSGHSIEDRIVDNLEHMMDEAGSDYERSVIHKWISKVKVDND